jgi:hypothetical protein
MTTDMTTCGNSYLSINGVKKCGQIDIGEMGENYMNFMNVEFAAGESVEFNFKLDNTDGWVILQIYTGPTPLGQ